MAATERIILTEEELATIADMIRASRNLAYTEPAWRVSRRVCWFQFQADGIDFMVLWQRNRGKGKRGRIIRVWRGSRPPRNKDFRNARRAS